MQIKRQDFNYISQQEGTLKLLSVGELRTLHDNIHILQTRHYNLSLEFSQLSKKQNDIWQQKLNSDFSACGCEMGTAFMLISLGSCIVGSFIQPGGLMALKFSSIFAGMGFIVLSAMIGKIVGLAIAQFRVKHNITKLIRQLE